MSRLDELTERARRTIERAAPVPASPAGRRVAGGRGRTAAPPVPVRPVEALPGLPRMPGVPEVPSLPVAGERRGGSPAPVNGGSRPFRDAADHSGGPGDGEIILGIDPGSGTTGYGVVRSTTGFAGEGGLGAASLVAYGVVQTSPREETAQRLLDLYRQVKDIIATYRPAEVAVEQLFFGRNVTTAVTVGQARGVALLAIAEAGIPLFEYKPSEIKFAVAGYGKADKVQMQRMVQRLLSLERVPRPDDAADALAICLCHLRYARTRHVYNPGLTR